MSFDSPIKYDLLKCAGVSSLAVGTTGTAYSYQVLLPLIGRAQFSLEIKLTSDGVATADVNIEQSNVTVATEAAADANFVVPYNYSAIASINDELVTIIPFAPTVSRYIRVSVTGTGSNDASTVISRLILSIAK